MKIRRPVLILVGMTILLTLAMTLDSEALLRAVRYALDHPLGLLAALSAYTASFVLRAFSWGPLLDEPVPLRKLFALIMGALFLNHIAPAKAGDLARMYALSRYGVSGERAVASVALSRLVDLMGLLVVLAVSWVLAGVGETERLLYPALLVISAAVALPFVACLRIPSFFGAVGGYARRLQKALGETSRRALLWALAFAIPAWVLEAGILLFVTKGVGVEIPLAGIVAATCFAVLVAAVPLTPGSLGTYEAGMVAILLLFGVATEPAFAIAISTHAMKFLYAFAGAPFAFAEGLAVVRGEREKSDEVGVEI